MAIYDNNGSANAEISKLYDNNGTTNTQIGKIYDNNGTTNSLVYEAELVIFPVDTVALTTYKQENGKISIGTTAITASSSFNENNTKITVTTVNTVNLTNYTKMTVTFGSYTGRDNWRPYVGIATSKGTEMTGTKQTQVTSNGAQTVTIDLSSVSGSYYLFVGNGIWYGTITSWKLQ